MANYYTDRYNSFLENASCIYEYLSGNYMDILEGRLLDCGSFEHTIDGVKIFRIAQYRKMENDQIMFDTFKNAIEGNLSSLHRNGCAACFFIVSDKNEVKLYFASETLNAGEFDSVLKNAIPDMKTSNTFISKRELERFARYGGVVTGAFNLSRNIINDILTYVKDKEAIIGIIAKPICRDIATAYYEDLADLHELASAFDGVNDTFGNATRINVTRQFPGVSILKDYTEKQYKRVVQNQDDLWESCLWFGSSEDGIAEELGGKIAGLLTSACDTNVEKGRYYLTTDNPLKNGKLAISDACFDHLEYSLSPSLLKGSLKTWVTTSELASMFQIPTRSFVGVNVISTNKTLNDISLFDTNVPNVSGDSFVLGNECETKQTYSLSINDFTEHALVTGGSGSGKTNTVKTLLENFYYKGIPFCVIEPSKKEYWNMIGTVANLRIYSSGFDANQLKLNPLEPEDGIIIGNHIADLMYALSGAFEMEEPTRLSLSGLIKYTYNKFGWDLDEIAYKQDKPYPTFSDVLKNLDEYSKIGIRSGSEVTANIEGSVIRRLDEITSGTTGNIINTRNGITGRELCSGSVLVELDDLSLETKPFLTNLLLVKMNQFLRQRDSSRGTLKNLIVLEEAHNIIPEPSKNGVEKAKDISSRFFSNMLSQIRDYGTGVIVADQGASQINSTTVANTKIKIVHALTQEADADAEAFALRLNRIQKERLPELQTGEAVVAIRGKDSVCKIKVKKNNISHVNNYACIFCKQRRFCELDEVTTKLQLGNRSELLLSKNYNNRFNATAIKNDVNTYLNSINLSDNLKTCAFGYMLAHGNMPCGEREKRRILFRYVE